MIEALIAKLIGSLFGLAGVVLTVIVQVVIWFFGTLVFGLIIWFIYSLTNRRKA
jgi:hypothetical protein